MEFFFVVYLINFSKACLAQEDILSFSDVVFFLIRQKLETSQEKNLQIAFENSQVIEKYQPKSAFEINLTKQNKTKT